MDVGLPVSASLPPCPVSVEAVPLILIKVGHQLPLDAGAREQADEIERRQT
jgi:hypothetical protein